MAAAVGGRGGKRENAGRKRKFRGRGNNTSRNPRVYLALNVFSAWRIAKNEAGYQRSSDSDFAAHLLSLEYRRRADLNHPQRQNCENRGKQHVQEDAMRSYLDSPQTYVPTEEWKTSTPCKGLTSGPRASALPLISESPIVGPLMQKERLYDEDVEMGSVGVGSNASISLHGERSDNDQHNASDKLNISLFTDDEEHSTDDSEEDFSSHDFVNSIMELNADENTEGHHNSDAGESDEEEFHNYGSSTDSADEGETSDTCDMPEDDSSEIQSNKFVEDTSDIFSFGPHKKFSRGHERYSMNENFKMVQEKKVVCSLGLLLELFSTRCQTPGCVAAPSIKYHIVGTTIVVTTVCFSGHNHRFCSSHEVNGVFVNNLQMAAAIILSGSNFAKVERMATFHNLELISKSSYYRFQRLYIVPEVNEWWCLMRKEVLQEFAGQDVVVGGDGQCDSPGFNAKNLCYYIVEVTTNYILDIEVLDKRHVGLISTNMEKEAVKRCLDRLQNDGVKVVEFVTDASISIKAMVETKYPNIIHSLDVWHKSKSIKKCLNKLGKPKVMKKVKDWSTHIVRHFWHCSHVCRSNAQTSDSHALKVMKDKWIGLLHHICNVHEWVDGQCDHEDGNHDESLPWFDRRDNDYQELQKIILNPELLKSFKFYTRFRHTGGIECANSLGLVYTPKRTPFRYSAYKTRRQLTAIDWNYHANLPQAQTKSGGDMISRKYNPRTRQWDVKVVKVDKGYEYIPVLISRILSRRADDFEGVTRVVDLNTSDPALIASTIAHVPPPPTNKIGERRSRFSNE